MSDIAREHRPFAAWTEWPLAISCVALAVLTLIWKTIGLDLVPGWNEMFGGTGAQYPRRVETLTPPWSIGYLLMYGVLGTAGTGAGLFVSLRRDRLDAPAGHAVRNGARVLGAFHVVIGAHHTVWAVTAGSWGHLDLQQFALPGLYLTGGVAGFLTGLHGLRLLRSTSADSTARIVRSKIAVDGASLLTFSSVFLFFAMNSLGIERNATVERWAWALVFIGPVFWLLAHAIAAPVNASRSRAI